MIAALPRWVRRMPALLLLLLLCSVVQAQDRVITGKITDSKDGSPLVGATVTVKGTTQGVSTGADGTFRINVPASAKTLVISSVGFGSMEQSIGSGNVVDVALTASNANLNEVVVVGYGTVRKKDLTGSVATVKEKDFNQGVMSAPDQLIQGKIAGVQILNNSGQPGGATTVRIRGTASIRAGGTPLYVVDGVQLPGGSARPGLDASQVGNTPDANPLNFINPQDIASMDVLKDASATAIYGSRGANGVVLITTKRGQSGQPKLDIASNFGVSSMLKKLEVLSADQYRDALSKYGVTGSDWGSSVDAMDAITRKAFFQNYTVGVSGGNENARLRASFGYYDQKGIIINSGMKKYTANLNGSFKFLESKKLGMDINILTSHVAENIAPISTNAGFTGSLVGQALQWNPTRALVLPDGSFNQGQNDPTGTNAPIFPATVYNPLAVSAAYHDKAKTTNLIASITPYFKITKDLEYRMLLSMNYALGGREQYFEKWINISTVRTAGGFAAALNSEQFSRQVTHTLNYNKAISKDFNLSATLGYEYYRIENKGRSIGAQGFPSNSLPYVDYLIGSSLTNRGLNSWHDPSAELQSMFGRANLNYKDKYLATLTMRADGSNKFGANNKYGYFPSVAVAWNVSQEDFLKNSTF
ncbi:MAG TPA: SusC/RagA family TonB-linked outer membrane protein, partial [Flavihumibacter sp.]|nr:SusC/RagA family TonB-linked outer membrane protein [Flavihumibacter sp.]